MTGVPAFLKCPNRRCLSIHVERLETALNRRMRDGNGRRWHPGTCRCSLCGREWFSVHPDSKRQRVTEPGVAADPPGRPSLSGKGDTASFPVRLPAPLVNRMKAHAVLLGISRAELVRRALDAFIQ